MIPRATAVVVATCAGWLLVGCPGSAPRNETAPPPKANGPTQADGPTQDGSDAMKKSMTEEETTFTRGPSITPARDLRAWLDAQRVDVGKARKIRLPVWVKMGVLGIEGARIGAADGPDVVKLELNDAALGISLADRANQYCKNADVCAMWLEGLWKGDSRFNVLKVHRAIAPGEQADFVEIEP